VFDEKAKLCRGGSHRQPAVGGAHRRPPA